VLLQQAPELIQHKRLRYEADSQTGYYSVMSMKGNPATFPVVKRLRLLCAEHDIELDIVWRPREDEHQRIADHWSKVEDDSAWVLNPAAYVILISQEVLGGRLPTIDIFASSTTTKVPDSFYSKYMDLDTKAVDAFVQPWAYCHITGSRHLAFINPPFQRMGEVVRKVAEEQVDCILVGPQWPRHWVAMLHRMPVRLTLMLPQWHDICIPSRYVSQQKRKKLQHPRYKMVAWFI